MLGSSFAALGLTDEETKTYLTLLETGPIAVGALSRKLGMPRPSLYGFLRRLQDKGLVTQSARSGVRTYLAEAPEKVALLFEKRANDFERQRRAFEDALPDLRSMIPVSFLHPKFQLYEGSEGLQFVLKDMLLYRDIETYAFWPIKQMVDVLSPAFFEHHNRERIRRNIYTKALWPAGQKVSAKDYPYLGTGEAFRREIRVAPKEIDCSMGYWIYNDKAAFISSRKESFGFIVESRELVEMLLSQFRLVWKFSKSLKPQPKATGRFLETV